MRRAAAPVHTVESVLATLRAGGKATSIATYRRHGIAMETFGTSYAVIRPLVKKLGIDHALARKLWATDIYDACIVALGIADPAKLTTKEIDGWLARWPNYAISAALASLAARSPSAATWAKAWIDADAEYTSVAGWETLGRLALAGRLPATDARALLARIEKQIHRAKNYTRYSMNNAMIAIGGSMPALTATALATARKIGTVDVDHGDTQCATPDATAYIGKMVARAKTRAAKAKTPVAKRRTTSRRSATA
jgi:3-methyladenine DNA glycosylase AlkD